MVLYKGTISDFQTLYTANVHRKLQGLYREIGVQGFQIYGDCMYTHNPCNFWSKSKKVWTFYLYSLLRFFKFPYNFCGNFRRTCNPRDDYMHFTGYVLRHWDPPHFLWRKNLQCIALLYKPLWVCKMDIKALTNH